MPATRTRTNSHDEDTPTRTRSRSRRSHTLTAEANRHVLQPARRMMRTGSRKMKRQISSLPGWMPWAVAGVGVAALIYGLSRIEAVQDFVSDIGESISDTLGGSDYFDEGDDEYGSESSNGFEGSDFGSTGAGGL